MLIFAHTYSYFNTISYYVYVNKLSLILKTNGQMQKINVNHGVSREEIFPPLDTHCTQCEKWKTSKDFDERKTKIFLFHIQIDLNSILKIKFAFYKKKFICFLKIVICLYVIFLSCLWFFMDIKKNFLLSLLFFTVDDFKICVRKNHLWTLKLSLVVPLSYPIPTQ